MSRQADSDQTKATAPPECNEGEIAFSRFDALVGAVMSVPRAVILKREAEYRKLSALNPHRRGPKPKVKQPSPSHVPDAPA